MKAGESMRRNFAQILKDAKIDVKVEYQKLYGMLYDRSIQVSNTSWISAYDEFSTYFFKGSISIFLSMQLMKMTGRFLQIAFQLCSKHFQNIAVFVYF